jgi:hypothetical protein
MTSRPTPPPTSGLLSRWWHTRNRAAYHRAASPCFRRPERGVEPACDVFHLDPASANHVDRPPRSPRPHPHWRPAHAATVLDEYQHRYNSHRPHRTLGQAAVRTEVTDRMLIFGGQHLRRVLATYAAHYNIQRPHRALHLRPPRPESPVPKPILGRIRRRPVLGGLINHYEPAA